MLSKIFFLTNSQGIENTKPVRFLQSAEMVVKSVTVDVSGVQLNGGVHFADADISRQTVRFDGVQVASKDILSECSGNGLKTSGACVCFSPQFGGAQCTTPISNKFCVTGASVLIDGEYTRADDNSITRSGACCVQSPALTKCQTSQAELQHQWKRVAQGAMVYSTSG